MPARTPLDVAAGGCYERAMKFAIGSGFLAGLTLTFALSACAGAEVQKSDRWASYPGCNEAQCKSWQGECSAECINQQTTTTTECENRCNARMGDCLAACPG